MIFELYYPAEHEFFEMVARAVPAWSLQITLESPDEGHRRMNGKWPWSNATVERTIDAALARGCRRVDVFFMVGLPHQRYRDALTIPDYCGHLIARSPAGRVRPFVAPLGPFLDPGSRAFEQPSFGYRRLCTTLDDHRRAFLHDRWDQILSYETDAMSRREIAAATYDVAAALNAIKRHHGLIDETTYAGVESRLSAARALLERDADVSSAAGHAALELANHGTMFGDDELKWPVRRHFRIGAALVRGLASGLISEIGHTAARLVGHFDSAAITRM
jgi:hypothetical protein